MKNLDKVYADNIANEYSPKTQPKIVALRKLDRKAKAPARLFGYTFGITSTLILGTGMTFAMDVLGDGSLLYFVGGIVVGVLGIIGCSITYPIYKMILKNSKAKYASDIIQLAKQISE